MTDGKAQAVHNQENVEHLNLPVRRVNRAAKQQNPIGSLTGGFLELELFRIVEILSLNWCFIISFRKILK
ncbi:MAG: hypothetical protein KKF44_06315 [Nanoarchaeota archaeon]|nr:hypothetical protein [Nanoarchaeota archaeon]